jgi:glycerol uptake facilitator-like aquaporin
VFPAEAVNVAMLGVPLPVAWASTATVPVVELVLTLLLMTSIFGTAVDDRGKTLKIGASGIGLTVGFDILAGGRVTGACAAALLSHHALLDASAEPPVREEWLDAGGRR